MAEPVFPYNEFRKGQKELALLVKEIVETESILSIRAPTGFGKTSSIIYGLKLADAERVLYLVRTVNELFPVIRELRRFNEPYTLLFSARRNCPLMTIEGKPPSPEDFWYNCRIARLKGICEYYSKVDELDLDEIRRLVLSSSDLPIPLSRQIAEVHGACPFFTFRRLVDSVTFTVATYPYFFRSDIFESILDPFDYKDFVVVIDEAHTLATVHSLLERRLRKSVVERSMEEVEKYIDDSEAYVQELKNLVEAITDLTRKKIKKPRRVDKEAILDRGIDFELIIDAAEAVRERKMEEAVLSGSMPVGRIRSWISRVALWVTTLILPESHLFIEPGEEEHELVTTPMDPSVIVKRPLQEAKAVILASGTLPRGDYVSELLGVERPTRYIDTDITFGRFMKLNNIYTIVARDVTTRYRERTPYMFKRLSAYVTLISRALPGLKLFIYPSYEVMRKIVGYLPVSLDLVIETRDTNLDEVEDTIRETPGIGIHAVASGKLVEGVEFVDDEGRNLLHVVTMVGVPYPQPDDYTRTMEEDLSKRISPGRARYYVFDFQTLVRIKQGLGRAIRSPEDKAVYIMLDYRYLRKELRNELEIPITRVIASMQGLASALAEARRHIAGYSSSRNDSSAS